MNVEILEEAQMKEAKIYIEICRKEAKLPKYMHRGDAGMDVYAAEEVLLEAGQTYPVKLGFKAAIPEGYEIQVRPRSGLSYKTRLRLPNSIGTIDAGYRGEFAVLLHNASVKSDPDFVHDEILTVDEQQNRPGRYQIRIGDRIAQLVLSEVAYAHFESVENVQDIGVDRGGGFGHSGTK